jgi:hypothetical protein
MRAAMYCRSSHQADDLYYQCYHQSHGLYERGVAVRASWLLPEVERRLLDRVGEAKAKERTLRAVDPVGPLAGEVKRIEGALGQLKAPGVGRPASGVNRSG